MKTKHFLIAGAFSIALVGLLFTACEKKSTTTTPNNNSNTVDITPAEDDANGQFSVEDTKSIADGASNSQAIERFMSGCESFTYGNHIGKFDTLLNSNNDSAVWVNFGNTDCNCLDGRKRKGQLFIYWSALHSYIDTTGTIGLIFHNYYMNDINIAGSRTLTGISSKSWSYAANLTLTYPNNGGVAQWNSNRTVAYTVTNTVSYWTVSGNASGTSRTGKTFNLTVTQPLYVTFWPWWLSGSPFYGCAWIEAGNISITVTGLQYPLSVNFGSQAALGPNDCHWGGDTVIYNNVKYPFAQW